MPVQLDVERYRRFFDVLQKYFRNLTKNSRMAVYKSSQEKYNEKAESLLSEERT